MADLAAVGLASAIAQFVEVGVKVVARLADFSAHLDQAPKAFREVKTELPLIIDGLRRLSEQINAGHLDASTQAALGPVLQECNECARRLEELLEKIIPAADASSWERRKKAIASLSQDRKVDEIADALSRYVRLLIFHQVVGPTVAPLPEPTREQEACPFWVVPYSRNPTFVGREDVFEAIAESFNVREGSQPKAALCGLGGIG